MPWRHTAPLAQKIQCLAAYRRRTLALTELGARYGVRRKAGDQWSERCPTSGPPGLEDRARPPCPRPHQAPQPVVEAVLAGRARHPSWGAKEPLALGPKRPPGGSLPGRSTVCAISRRHGLVPKQRHRRHSGHPGNPPTRTPAPHEGWSAACKGQVTTGAGLYGAPWPAAAGSSRLLRGGQARSSPRAADAEPGCPRPFQGLGVPTRLRPDPGVPWATTTPGRLSPRAAWRARLGSLPECIAPGTPRHNGRHGRRHRALQAETTRPPARTRRAQQRPLARCRAEGNDQRPHEARARHTPASRDAPSPRQRPHGWPPLADPGRFAGRYVSANGGRRWHHPWGTVSHTCVGERVGREETDDGSWPVYCGPLTLGRRRERPRRSEDISGRLKRPR